MWAEWVKSRRALPPLAVSIAVSIALTIGVVVTAAGMLLSGGRGGRRCAAGPIRHGRCLGGLVQHCGVITAAGGLLGAGVLLSWMFGREFTDGALPRLITSSTPRHGLLQRSWSSRDPLRAAKRAEACRRGRGRRLACSRRRWVRSRECWSARSQSLNAGYWE